MFKIVVRFYAIILETCANVFSFTLLFSVDIENQPQVFIFTFGKRFSSSSARFISVYGTTSSASAAALVTTRKDHGTAESDGGPRCKLSSRLTSAAAEIKSANLGLQDGRQQEWAREMRQGVQVRVAHSTEECSTTLAGNRLYPAKLVCVFL